MIHPSNRLMINQFLATTDAVSHSSTFVFSAPIRSITITHVFSVRRPVSDSIAPRPLSPQASQQSSLTSKVPKTNMPGSGLRTSLRRPHVSPSTANSPISLVVKSVLHLISLFPSFPYVDPSVPSVCPLHKYNHISGRISPLRCCSGETFSFFGITPQMSALCTTIVL